MAIEMERKIFGQGIRFGLPKERVLEMLRLIRSAGNGSLNASKCADANEDLGQSHVFNVCAYLTVKRRMHEVETEKAIIIKELRHENWKAGGPV